jgi:hypothetical protein
VIPEVPVKLNNKQKKLIKQLEELQEESNYPGVKDLHEKAEAFFERRDAMKK